MCRIIKVILSILLFAKIATKVANDIIDEITVDEDGLIFVDSKGRQRFFHGINRIQKTTPYFPVEALNIHNISEDLIIEKIGLNVVRLGCSWIGVMPEPGIINYTYLYNVKKIVQYLAERGIYTLLDSHQDTFSENYCGNGFLKLKKNFTFPFPLNLPYKHTDVGNVLGKDCSKIFWPLYYFSYDVGKAFEELYTNQYGLRDYYVQFFEEVAKYFADVDGVLGYDIINEPFPGNFYSNPSILFPSNANDIIFKFQDTVIRAIRKFDVKKICFFEGVTYSLFEVKLDYVPGGEEFKNKTAISYHYYKYPNVAAKSTVRINNEAAKKNKIGVMMTEFASYLSGIQVSSPIKVFNATNEKLNSWLAWDDSFSNLSATSMEDPGATITLLILKQTYPLVVAGKTEFIRYNHEDRSFNFSYFISSKVTSNETIIYSANPDKLLNVVAHCQVSKISKFPYIYFIHHNDCSDGERISISTDQ